jgi:hypothetical protein
MTGIEIVKLAKEQLAILTGMRPDTVSKMRKDSDGWHVVIEVVEMKAVPDSKDVLATYETLVDEQGTLLSYERTARYRRGEVS